MDFERGGKKETFSFLEKALVLSERVFQKAINPEDFIEGAGKYGMNYSQESVLKDLNLLQRMEEKIRQQNNEEPSGQHSYQEFHRKLARAFEGLVLARERWFGENAKVIVPSRFDDVINGIDGIVEFDNKGSGFSTLALGIDVTTGSHQVVAEKIAKICLKLKARKLSEINYYVSANQRFKGKMVDVPKVVVALENPQPGGELDEMLSLWVQGSGRELASHPYHIKMLISMKEQLRLFGQMVEEMSFEEGSREQEWKTRVQRIFFGDYLILERLLEQKRAQLGEEVFAKTEREMEAGKRRTGADQSVFGKIESIIQSYRMAK